MNLSSSEDESTSKRQENGDVSSTSERPLKKARFAWQVKGKYHLRNEAVDSRLTVQAPPERAGPVAGSDSDSNDMLGNTEQNLEILGDYLLKQDFNTLDSVITDHDKSLLKPCPSIPTERLPYPRYVCSYDNNDDVMNHSKENMLVPMSMVHTAGFSEDQCIARWQARQMAKGFVDNTINRVLDSWTAAPRPADLDTNRFLALDVAEFINNLPGDNSIENEGILMAISAHGLQNKESSGDKSGAARPGSLFAKVDAYPSPPASPACDDGEEVQPACLEPPQPPQPPEAPLVVFDERQLFAPCGLCPRGAAAEGERVSYYDGAAGHRDELFADTFDFMDTAVSFAIQSRGLASYGADYG